ncbi:MAG: endolytic transglycosylase MltG [Clostridia bacterium]|nr:endolytic transglycosylase MltG [Clostridia bacterium]MBR6512962.1 endolytic transglycosylase MltG [Clostridia bacterium]
MKKTVAVLLLVTIMLTFGGCAGVKEYLWPTPTTAAPQAPTSDIMIVPGWSIVQVAEALEKGEVCSAESFLEAAKVVPPGYDTLVDGLGSADGYLFAAEGFLIANTYNMSQNKDGDYALHRLLNISSQTLDAIAYDGTTAYARAEQLGMNMFEVFTLASIIQYEANLGSTDKDFEIMQQVSSVFHNRLDHPYSGFMYIGSDATRKYVEVKMKKYIEDNGLDYNKYFEGYCTNDSYDLKTAGLPVGPVGAPSVMAIKAALWPADTNYYFFFTDKDNNFHFYTNYEDFQNEWNNKYKH